MSENSVQGKLIAFGETKSGQGQNGAWKFITAVIETTSQYPKKAAVQVWNKNGLADKVAALGMGTEIKFSFDIESKDHNGKWYTNATAFKYEVIGVAQPAQGYQNGTGGRTQPAMQPNQQFNATAGQPSTDNQGNALNDATADLPFLHNQSVTHN